MPRQKTAGILIMGALLALVAVVWALNELADSISSILYKAGLPAGLAADVNSIIFFGGGILILIFVLKNLPRFSRI